MPAEHVAYALRAQPRSRLAKLLLIAVLADIQSVPGDEDYVPCLSSLDRMAEVGMCSPEEAKVELEALLAAGFLTWLSIYEDGSVVADAVQPEIVAFGQRSGE
jgi:hypothetical protein